MSSAPEHADFPEPSPAADWRPLAIGIDGRELQGRPTGTGRYLRNLLRRWSRPGRDRLVVFVRGTPPHDPAFDGRGIEVRALPRKGGPGAWWTERCLARAAARDRLDVFFSPAYVCPLTLDLPRVTAIHDVSFFSCPDDFAPLDGLRRRLLTTASVRASAAVLACSRFTEREIATLFPDAASRVVHVPLGPDEDLPPGPPREEARALLGVRGPVLLSVGTILNRRRLPVLLRATAHLARRWPGLVLEVVGENRTYPPLDLPGLVDGMGLHRTVRLSGYVSDAALAARYAAADVCVFLSEYEGFGLPALEAMARGVPVVTSTRPSLGEIFRPAALLVDPSDEGAVAEAIASVLAGPSLAADLAQRGRRLAARYSWDRTASLVRRELARAAFRT